MVEKPTYQELEQRIKALEENESRLMRVGAVLKENEAYLKTLIRTIPDLVWLKDRKGIYLFCNSRFERFFGAEEKDIIGKSDYDFVDKELADFFREHDQLAMAKGAPSENEEEITYADDGHKEYLKTTITPIYDNNGELIGVLGIGRDISEQRRAESERLADLKFFESLDKVNRVIQSNNDLDRMMSTTLDAVLSIFNCDRAYLLYACDPSAPSFDIQMERTGPGYPGAFELGVPIPMTPPIQQLQSALLDTQGPMQFSLGKEIGYDEEPWKQFEVKSVLAITLHPKVGKPWLLGLHQCSHTRAWTLQEQKLFQEISRRIADGLTSLLVYRDLQKNQEDYHTILDAAPYSIVITRLSDNIILLVNKAYIRRTGHTLEETVRHSAADLNLYDNPSERKRIVDILRREGQVNNEEISFRSKGGRLLESMISMSPIRFQGEDCIVSMTVDINDLKQTQRALEESESRFRTIFETAADPIFLNDMETGKFIDANYAASYHLGYPRSQLMKMSLGDIQPADAFDPIAHLKKNPDKGENIFYESTHIRKDGSRAIVEVSSQPLIRRDRKIFLSLIRDVTQRKQTEVESARYRRDLEKMVDERTAQLEAAQDELIKKEKLAVLGQLTATVSHELRNPLGVIRSSNFFLQRKIKDRDEKADKHFKRIDEQISLCEAIVADLLEYTRGRDVVPSQKSLSPWLLQVVEQIREQENIDVKAQIAPNLPSIPHDEEKMRRVVLNLLTNAVQAVNVKVENAKENDRVFMPEIVVEANPENRGIAIAVSDNGIGMNRETRKSAFEPLFTTRSRGTGLGLAIVKKIVEDHKGSLTLESRPEEGTRIKIILPSADGAASP